jgi:hypothetical protein
MKSLIDGTSAMHGSKSQEIGLESLSVARSQRGDEVG